MRRAILLAAGLAAVPSGCDEPEPLAGGLVLGTIDAYRLCDVNAVEVRLRAQWQACPEAEPGCEAPEQPVTEGDRMSCPATSATYDLGVELALAGLYRIEAVTVPTTGPLGVECFSDPQTGEAQVQLRSDRLHDSSPLVLRAHGPCP